MNLSRIRKLVLAPTLVCTFIGAVGSKAFAEDIPVEDLDVVELELEKSSKEVQQSEAKRSAPAPTPVETEDSSKPLTYSDLGSLAPFSEVSVLQKRFMPKTGRMQLFGGLSTITNDPFFLSVAATGKAAYYFSEAWGVELNYFGISTSSRKATDELKKVNGVSTQNLVQAKSFLGLDLVYTPIYGKMTLFNEKIIPFDLYFAAGYGTTQTQAENAGTFHLATGQVFALTKSFGLRWDFSWNFYSAKGIDGSSGQFNNLFLTVGASFFFPEAGYR